MKLIEKTLIEFSKDVDSDLPAPGGGSVAAYVSNLGVALARMMGHLTISKKAFKELDDSSKEKFNNTFNKLEDYYQKLLMMVDEDTVAFNKIMASFKLPKDTDEEKEVRSKAIQDATLEATIAPFEATKLAYEALLIVPELIDNGNVNAISDLGSAIYLLEAGMNCSILNVKINASGLKDKDKAQEFNDKCHEMQKNARHLVEENILKISNLM
ncbi:MAG: cyclodeaminase/cyclohydrolase family protein [Bacilli bacterium]|jgi:formiminotetrahydrofolate cyclodeaminase|nr:cyclodeaminase/cyclohydrolase family protein [Bacilli bacterium]